MPIIKFINRDKEGTYVVVAQSGKTVMEAAVWNSIPGIDAFCAGAGLCGTCLVEVDSKFQQIVTPITRTEEQTLLALDKLLPGRRLSCQITVTDIMGEAVFFIPTPD